MFLFEVLGFVWDVWGLGGLVGCRRGGMEGLFYEEVLLSWNLEYFRRKYGEERDEFFW